MEFSQYADWETNDVAVEELLLISTCTSIEPNKSVSSSIYAEIYTFRVIKVCTFKHFKI
jgi:hypothetical protein